MRQLRYFTAIAEHLHYGNAAKVLFVSQPALSQQINLLEEYLGVELFVRQARHKHHRVELTEAGKVFLVEARRILQLCENAAEMTRRVGYQRKTLRLGIYKMMLRERIVEIVQVISSKFPDLGIKLIEYQSFLQVQDALKDDFIDLGVTLLPLKHEELGFRNMISSHLSVLLPVSHRLADRPYLFLEDLRDEKWIEIEKPLRPFLDELENALHRMGFGREANIVLEVNSFDVLRSMVALGIGVSFLPSIAKLYDTPGVVAKPLMDTPEVPFSGFQLNQGIAWKKSAAAPAVLAVSEAVESFYAGYVPNG